MATIMERLPQVLKRTGDARSTIYRRIGCGLFPPPVFTGPRSRAWPDYETDAVNAARIAGKSEEEIRRLVADLVAKRKEAV